MVERIYERAKSLSSEWKTEQVRENASGDSDS